MTKKITSIVLVVCMILSIFAIAGVSVQAAEGDTNSAVVYLKPGVWDVDNAWFAAYFFNGTTANSFQKMTKDGDNYKVNIPAGTWPNVIFVRMDSAATTPNWDQKWNQTGDLTLQAGKMYQITGWNETDGQWVDAPVSSTTETTATDSSTVPSSEVATNTPANNLNVYLKAGVWDVDNAWFAAYFFNNADDNMYKWEKMTKDGSLYKAPVPTKNGLYNNQYNGVIFVRMDSAATTPNWDQKWNQTADLSVQLGKTYEITGWGENDGQWIAGPVVPDTTQDPTSSDTIEESDESASQDTTSNLNVYLKAGVWDVDNAWFAAYFFNNADANMFKWEKMTKDGSLYKAAVPTKNGLYNNQYNSVIFVRMDSAATTPNWDQKWNQTADLSVQVGKTYEITGWGADTSTGQWIAGPTVATDPTVTDPTVTDPTVTDPTVTDPTVTDPTVTDPTGPVYIPSGFKINALNLSLGSNIAMQAKVNPSKVAEYDTYWVTFSADGKDDFQAQAKAELDNTGKLVFVYDQIFANELYKDVDIVLHATKNGVEYYGATYTTSIEDYALNGLKASSSNDKYKTLLVNLLNYGSAAQTYTNSSAPLVNATLTADQQALAITNPTLTTVSNSTTARINDPTYGWSSTKCILGSSIQPKLIFTDKNGAGIEGVTVRVVFNGETYFLDDIQPEGNNKYSVTFDKVNSDQLDVPLSCTVMKNGAAVSNTYRFSVEGYANSVLGGNFAQADKDMITAMVCYGDAAYNYAH